MYTEEMKKAISFVDDVIIEANKEWENVGVEGKILRHDYPLISEYIVSKLNTELEKATDESIISRLKKEIYGFEHTEARTFAINHGDVSESELIEALLEYGEHSVDEARTFAEQVRTYKNL